MASNRSEHVAAAFSEREDARRATRALKDAGFTDAHVGLAGTGADDHAEGESKMGAGAVAGAATGAGLGALWGLGILAGFLPAIGPAIAGGTLAAILSSAAAGAAAAGLAGALLGMGFSKEEADFYDAEMKSGSTIVTVHAGSRRDEAVRLLRSFGGYDFEQRRSSTSSATVGRTDATTTTGRHSAALPSQETVNREDMTIQANEEQLRVRKEPVQQGEVKVRKEVHTEHKTIDVPVTREEVIIERRPGSGQPSAGHKRGNEEVRIPIREDQVHVEKETIVGEEVVVGKRRVQDTKHVDANLRKEEIRVEKDGDVRIQDRR
jgi:uncharacterized protein (TIGR02271 family)